MLAGQSGSAMPTAALLDGGDGVPHKPPAPHRAAHGCRDVLLIGVADNGDVLGIEQDVTMLPKRQDVDAYENHLTTLLEQGIGAAATANAHVSFEQVAGKTVCRVAVKPSSSPVWTKQKGLEEAFYVRLNNSTRPLGSREAHEYISQHFR
jgi:Putative DNA-binding domain